MSKTKIGIITVEKEEKQMSYTEKFFERLKIVGIKVLICLVIPFIISITFGHMTLAQIFSSVGDTITGGENGLDLAWVWPIGLVLYLVASVLVAAKKTPMEGVIGPFIGYVVILIFAYFFLSWFIGSVCFAGAFGIDFNTMCSYMCVVYFLGPVVIDAIALVYYLIRFIIEKRNKRNNSTSFCNVDDEVVGNNVSGSESHYLKPEIKENDDIVSNKNNDPESHYSKEEVKENDDILNSVKDNSELHHSKSEIQDNDDVVKTFWNNNS